MSTVILNTSSWTSTQNLLISQLIHQVLKGNGLQGVKDEKMKDGVFSVPEEFSLAREMNLQVQL